MKNKYWSVCFLIFVGVILFSRNSLATPQLGVATGTGIYAYTDSESLTDEYINYFAEIILPADVYEGFVIGESGDTLTVFTSYNPLDTIIYLMADTGGNNMGSNHDEMLFDGMLLTLDNTIPPFTDGKAAGYKDMPYAYLALPQDLSYWTENVFENSKTFYLYEAEFEYTGDWTTGHYMWAAAEINSIENLQYSGSGGKKDKFSPKTTSAGGYPVPLPTTILLFGIGLIGLIGVYKIRKDTGILHILQHESKRDLQI
jgi:hypothetical protein